MGNHQPKKHTEKSVTASNKVVAARSMKFRVGLIGDQLTGKTSLCLQVAQNQPNVAELTEHPSTLNYKTNILGYEVNLMVEELGRNRPGGYSYFSSLDACFLTYSSQLTLNSIRNLYKQFERYNTFFDSLPGDDICTRVIIVQTKSDLVSK
jgi:GTPase SAR1 family protein